MPQKNFLADSVICQECLVNGIFQIIVFLRNLVTLLEDLIVFTVQKDHRIQLLRISHQHQVLSPDDRKQGHGRAALAGLIYDGQVKMCLRASDPVG